MRKARTILDDLEPLTEIEQLDWQRKQLSLWFERTLNQLIAVSDADANFAKTLCRKISDNFGEDADLSLLMLKRLRVSRMVKPRGRRNWSHARYIQLLIQYALLLKDKPRHEVLVFLADKNGLDCSTPEKAENSAKKIENRITSAKKLVTPSDLPDFAQSIFNSRTKTIRGGGTPVI